MDLSKNYKRHVAVFAGIHRYAHQHDRWQLVIDEWLDHTLPARGSRPAPYDGIVGRISERGATRARRLNLPAVNVHFSSDAKSIHSVFPDYAACGRLRAEHLLARGFRNFGVLVHHTDQSEAEAFEQAVTEQECDSIRTLFLSVSWPEWDDTRAGYQTWRHTIQEVEQWMNTWRLPIGVYIRDLDAARYIIQRCAERGWRVPEDVAIVAGFNEEQQCERPEPSITSLEVPNEEVGYEAARLLDRLIDDKQCGRPPAPPQTVLLPPVGIVPRRSTDFFAVDDESIRTALRFIDESLHRPISVDDVAAAISVSRRTLTSRFRAVLHRGVAAEIERLRIERAMRELAGSDASIQRIAQRVGFASIRTFNERFRAAVGCTPSEFRRSRTIAPSQ
jgi:LacI family transcriptional regulator